MKIKDKVLYWIGGYTEWEVIEVTEEPHRIKVKRTYKNIWGKKTIIKWDSTIGYSKILN